MAASEKLVSLSALQTLAEKVNGSFATKAEVETLNTGEENVLESVKVNGTTLDITDKAVDLEITTGTENGTIAVSGSDVAVQGLGTLAYASEVSESELSADLQSTLSGKADSSGLEALEALVGTLPEDTTAETVVDYVAAEVASIIADADEDYDTLKEISDWISGHADDASEMNSQISSNTSAIEALTALVGTLPEDAESTTVVDYVSEAVSSLLATDDEVSGMLSSVFDETEE